MSMVPATKNWIIPLGTDWERSIVLKQTVAGELVPIDLTGYSARMQIRAKAGGTLLCDLTEDNSRIVIEPEAGRVTMRIPDAVSGAILTAGLPIKTVVESRDPHGRDSIKGTGPTAVYDLELVSAGGDVQRPIQGETCLTLQVTA